MYSTDNHYYEKFDDGTINDITDEIPFEIPSNWCWTRLKNLSYLISDGTHKTPKYVSNGIPFISVKDISSGILNFENTKYIMEEEHLQLTKRCKPEKDDLLICRIGTLGKAIKINVDNEFSIFVSLGLIKLLNKEIADYLVYVINSVYGFNWIEKNKVGGGTHTFKINLEDLKEMLLPLPPANEQNKIVEKTNCYIPYISKYEIVYKKLENLNNSYKEELKKSILQYAIQGKLVPQNPDDGSADILIQSILDEKRKLIKEKQIKKENLSVIYKDDTDNQFYEKFDDGTIINITDEIPFDIPNNWCWSRLGNIISIKSGEGLTSNKMIDGNVPVYGGNGITGYHNQSIIHTPTIVIGRVGFYCGSVHLTENEAWVTDNAFITKYPENYINQEYLIYMLKFLNLGKSSNATAQPVVSGKKIYPLLAPIPPSNEQICIANKLKLIFEIIETAE